MSDAHKTRWDGRPRLWPLCAIAIATSFSQVFAQTCSVVSSSIQLSSGTCPVAPGTTLNQIGSGTPIVTATNPGTMVDLTPGATLVGNGYENVAVTMLNGGIVRLGANTPITLNQNYNNATVESR